MLHAERSFIRAFSFLLYAILLTQAAAVGAGDPESPLPISPTNLLLNPGLDFHAFENSRQGQAVAYRSGAVACWDQEAYGDCEVFRAPRVIALRPRWPVDNVVVIHAGKRFSQFNSQQNKDNQCCIKFDGR